MGSLISFFIGIILGVVSCSVFAYRSYEKGVRDERNRLPQDVNEFLNLNK
jgi:hypothetical protein